MPKFLMMFLLMCAFAGRSQSLQLVDLDTAHYFDFWEGTWEGTWPEGEKVGRATNQLTWIAGDKVLQENFEIIEGQNKGFKGTSISVYRPNQGAWKQAWADNQGGYYDFTGAFEGDERIFRTDPIDRNGQIFVQRMVFKDIKIDSFTWDWESSQDDGKTWNLNWRISYVRKE